MTTLSTNPQTSSPQSHSPNTTSSQTVHPGMGAIPHQHGVAFRVWAPHADGVAVVGDFNDWSETSHPLTAEENGFWYLDVPEAAIGQEYRYLVTNGEETLSRIDPYAREVTNSVGNAVVQDPHFDWEGDAYELPAWNELVIYELHIGTFNRRDDEEVGTFEGAIEKLGYLRDLGVNVVQIMPTAEFAGDLSWGYNPAHPFAVESAYGGPEGLKRFVKAAHQHGIGVILDVVYNHFGPSDLDLWRFDGWSENDGGGIYFYNDHRRGTPWGDTRPDYGRPEVRQYIRDNALMWLDDFRIDGLRYDMTLYIRSLDATGATDIPEGWSLVQWINREIAERHPDAITIAEDLQTNEFLTKGEGEGGANFGSQWDAEFVHPVRDVLTQVDDEHRSMRQLAHALSHRYNLDAFERVVYSESHDEVANGKTRVPAEVNPDDPTSREAQKRSTLGLCLVLTAPGIPMLLQAQEFLWDRWFQDTDPVDWSRADEHSGLVRLTHDLIGLRRNLKGVTAGLLGQHVDVAHVNDDAKTIAFRRWSEGGAGDETLVVANVSNTTHEEYRVGVPAAGTWHLRFNSDWIGYSEVFDDVPVWSAEADNEPCDGFEHSIAVPLPAYSAQIFSQNP